MPLPISACPAPRSWHRLLGQIRSLVYRFVWSILRFVQGKFLNGSLCLDAESAGGAGRPCVEVTLSKTELSLNRNVLNHELCDRGGKCSYQAEEVTEGRSYTKIRISHWYNYKKSFSIRLDCWSQCLHLSCSSVRNRKLWFHFLRLQMWASLWACEGVTKSFRETIQGRCKRSRRMLMQRSGVWTLLTMMTLMYTGLIPAGV